MDSKLSMRRTGLTLRLCLAEREVGKAMTRRTFVFLLLFVGSLRAQVQYFPPHALCREREMEHCERGYVAHLRASGQPSLWKLAISPTAESYRFLWLRTFHRPVSARLRIAKNGSG